MIRIKVPGTLKYRDLAVRAVSSACKLVAHSPADREHREFTDQVVSAFGEAYNNAALHCYDERFTGDLEIEIDLESDVSAMIIRVLDYGNAFDLLTVPDPDLDSLPEAGLGIFIIKSFMDDVSYRSSSIAGAPNVLSMTKRLRAADMGDERRSRP